MSLLNKIYHGVVSRYHTLKYRKMFKSYGYKSYISKPLRINHPENIVVGDNVRVGCRTWLAAACLTGDDNCELVFHDGATIGDFNHIYATGSVVFEKDALTANFVYISDNLHCFEDIETPIKNQPIKQLHHVTIGEGCWIGEHVSIIGASVGKHSVIGANSVVTHDIPDYCVAVGSPARIIKRYNFDKNQWEKTDKEGNFITK